MLAYVLVKIHPGKECGVACEIGRIEGVTEAEWTYGFCDIMVNVKTESMEQLEDVVLNRIRKIPGVQSTQTITVSPIPIHASRTSADLFRNKQVSRNPPELSAAAE